MAYLAPTLAPYKPQSPTPSTPPTTPSPKSPSFIHPVEENRIMADPLPVPVNRDISYITPATTPDAKSPSPVYDNAPVEFAGSSASASAGASSGSGVQDGAVLISSHAMEASLSGSGRERISPTRATGLRDQQQQHLPSIETTQYSTLNGNSHRRQPSQFTPAYYHNGRDGGPGDLDTPAAIGVGIGIGSGIDKPQARRQFGNPAPSAYTAPNSFPLSRVKAHSHEGISTSRDGRRAESPSVRPAPINGFYDSPAYWLSLYFFFNLGLTLFNKIVLVSFPFPYTLTGLHALSGCAGCYFALERGAFQPAHLTQKENLILAAFSVLYTINIAVSNISLQMVTVPFHQVVRASTPLFTILIATIFLRTKFSMMKLISLLPVVAGVGFATYGDYYFTPMGLILTLLGTFLAALKTIVTNLIQTGGGGRLRLHPLDLLMRMSPLAFIQCVIYGYLTGELDRVRAYGATQMTRGKAVALLVNGVIACGLNIVSFTANKKAGPLTMTVSANCKQVLTIALAVVLFDLHINFLNGVGILLTLIGGGWYGYVEYTEKAKKKLKEEKGDKS